MMNSYRLAGGVFRDYQNGAWAVPLNFRFTGDEIKYCADIAEARMMIFSEEFTERVVPLRNQLPTFKITFFAGANVPDGMEPLEDVIREASPKPPKVKITPEDTCGLYFTSGTTGEPKPIVLTMRTWSLPQCWSRSTITRRVKIISS